METFITEKPGNVYTYSIIKDKVAPILARLLSEPLQKVGFTFWYE